MEIREWLQFGINHMSERLQKILANPTLHPNALMATERLAGGIKWHKHANSPRSSQAFCISAFGTLRHLKVRDKVLDRFLSAAIPTYQSGRLASQWSVYLEREIPKILNERGGKQPTSIDVLLVSSNAVFTVEAKFVADARSGFGGCSQFRKGHCAGFFGPGSDQRTSSQAWCRLEIWEGERSPRTYWTLGREYFRPEVFLMQESKDVCPLRGSNYQLMRNFLFGSAYARKNRIGLSGVITIAPAATSKLLKHQVKEFQSQILRPEYANQVSHVTYEQYTDALCAFEDEEGVKLANFLKERIGAVVRE